MFKIFFGAFFIGFLTFSSIQATETLEKKKEKILEILKTIPGWCSPEKASVLFDLVINKKPEVCVEIGTFGGASIFPIAMALKDRQKGIVYAIDAWDNQVCIKNTSIDDAAHYKWWYSVNLTQIYEGFIKLLDQFSLTPYCKVLVMTSEKALNHIPMKIDVLHIDGDNSKTASLFDAMHYGPRVKIGGVIVFDDVLWESSSTHERTTLEALEYLKTFCKEIRSIDNGNCIFFIKLKETI